MATIVYLDPDDEITSAATRIRTADGTRVGLVLPFGSRVATSRINFRLLAREAQANGRRLDIVAPDASARALAASAGLPVFASVGEYEAALDGGLDDAGEAPAAVTAVTAAGATAATIAAVAGPTTAGATGGPSAGASSAPGQVQAPGEMATLDPKQEAELDEIVRRSRQVPVAKPRRRRPGAGAIVAVLILVLALAVSGVAAALVLPSAQITLTPRIEPVGPVSLTVTADPAATAVDPAGLVIPAQTIEIPVTTSGEFPATGKRVDKTKATGGVRWTNCDPTAAYTIPKGSIVRTSGGTGFATDKALFLPVAGVSGLPPSLKLKCTTSEVAVTAVNPGPGGNVGARTIRVVPARYNRTLITVTNLSATKGGLQQEFPKVVQKDVDAALVSLKKDLGAQFATSLENPDGVPPGATVFPSTAVLGDPVPAPDPATLVGQEVPSFTLSLAATGTVLAVDTSPVEAIAQTSLAAAVGAGHELVDGSMQVKVGEGVVTEGLIDFPVAGSARQVPVLDAATLERQVLGLSETEAKSALGAYGDVAITLWPGWVKTIPTLDQRVTFSLAGAVDANPQPTLGPSPRPTPASVPTSSAGPGASGDAAGSEPVPSG
jgi:Baseplate J-like protein